MSTIKWPFDTLIIEKLGLDKSDLRTPRILEEWTTHNLVLILDGYDEINVAKFGYD